MKKADAEALKQGSSPLTRGKRPVWPEGQPGVGLIPAHAGKTRRRFRRSYVMGAHPRSRGENSMLKDRLRYEDGSSPLTRGKRVTRASRSRRWGLIPAHAGKTPRRCPGGPRTQAHPRSRGENFAPYPVEEAVAGSSPLTRGKRLIGRNRDGRVRLIPAHAGKT